MERITTYFNEVLKELRKVNWPSRDQLLESTVVTVIASVSTALFMFGVDQVISRILELIYT